MVHCQRGRAPATLRNTSPHLWSSAPALLASVPLCSALLSVPNICCTQLRCCTQCPCLPATPLAAPPLPPMFTCSSTLPGCPAPLRPCCWLQACEMFILELTLRSWMHAEDNKRRTLQRSDVAAAVNATEILDFLVGGWGVPYGCMGTFPSWSMQSHLMPAAVCLVCPAQLSCAAWEQRPSALHACGQLQGLPGTCSVCRQCRSASCA
jgi:hypothetical protein